MHAVVVTVSIAAGQIEQARKALREQVVPRVRQAPGLVKAYWTARADGAQGTSISVFQTQQHAESAAAMVKIVPPPPGVTLNSVEVREVIAET